MDRKLLLKATEIFGSPIYLYDLDKIKSQVIKFNNSFKSISSIKIQYAAKALSNVSILKFIKNLDCGLDAVSIQEIKLGIKAGFKTNDIIYTPNGVSIEEIKEAVKLGVKINLDSIESINEFSINFPKKSIFIRINPNIFDGGNDKISVGHSESKFGIPINQIEKIISLEKENKISIDGIHVHSGSDISNIDSFIKGAKTVFNLALLFKNIKFIDLGGGFKVPYFKGDTYTDMEELGEKISDEFNNFKKEYNKDLELIFEPGKYLVSEAGYFLTKVNYVKEGAKNKFAQINSGFNHFIRPALYNSYHEIENISNSSNKKEKYSVVGYICENDTFAKDRNISKIKKGDILCFNNAGAYGFSMSSNYNSRYTPSEVCYYNNDFKLIRKGQEMKDLFNNQIIIDL
jgi:diaminopimelate decarboxylase